MPAESNLAPRFVVFTGDPSYGVRKGIVEVAQAIPGSQWLILWHSPRKACGQLLRSQRLNLRRNGWRWIPYQTRDVLARLYRRVVPLGQGRIPNGAPGQEYSLQALLDRPQIQVKRVADIHGVDSIAALTAFGADLGLSLAAPILRAPLFMLPRLGTLNLHKGAVPEFRGMPPAFWERWHGVNEVGCTVHWVDEGLDTGAVEAATSLTVARFSSVRGLQLQLDEIGVELMNHVVQRVIRGQSVCQKQVAAVGKANRKPTLAQQANMARREEGIDPHGSPTWRRVGKSFVQGCALRALLPLTRWRAPRVTVLLFHRVSDEVRDNLTVGVAQFERQMALLRQYCDVLSIDEVLDLGERIPSSQRPQVSVTFDDGYLDNFTLAAPILRRHQVPAAFFVSTGIVNSVTPFPHDLRRGNGWVPVMNWDQLRTLREWGFTIGSHTVGHIDCAKETESVVRAELAQSSQALERELGVTNPLFAYPYGGRQHMTAERLEWVRDAGYRGCLSAYGGVNVRQVERYNVLRRGVHWEFSDAAFLMLALGLT